MVAKNILNTNRTVLWLIVFILGALCLEYYSNDQRGQKGRWQLITARRGDLSETIIARGHILAKQPINVTAAINGTVSKIFHKAGDYVKKGGALVSITPQQTDELLANNKDELQQLVKLEEEHRAYYDEMQDKLSKGKATQIEFDHAKAQFEASKIKRQKAQQDLALRAAGKALVGGVIVDTTIVSPISGYLLEDYVQVGDKIHAKTLKTAGNILYTVADLKQLKFSGIVQGDKIKELKPGLEVRLTIPSQADYMIKGRVKDVVPAKLANESFGMMIEVDTLKPPPQEQVTSGFVVTANVILHEARDAVLLPRSVVNRVNDYDFVYFPLSDKRLKAHKVKLGVMTDKVVQIIEGVKPGQQVVNTKYYNALLKKKHM